MAGNKAIISGCEEVGNTITPGTVFINGELFPFEGGAKGDTVIIKEETNEVTFEDGFLRPLENIRTAAFGRSTPEKTYNWEDFQRITNLQDLGKNKTDNTETKKLLERIEKLEKQKQAVPIGLIALWGKPANEIPAGWREYVNLRGKMPIGLDPDYVKKPEDSQDYGLNQILKKGGERSHKLTIEEMPAHNHQLYYRETQDDAGNGGDGREFSTGSTHSANVTNVGGDHPHNNMPPYRVVQFIEYIGFN
nr:MAG TPA: Baseplate structural protein [Caudoviricetes sp.]